ncbi:MAG: hypothetical protein IPQ08_05955 [Chitinophagaceae bacterium]|nr:hypothetical protein [Chitinophagaceae bacterium]
MNANTLKFDIITKVLPVVDRYIEKRYRFAPEKQKDLYSMISSLKDAFTKGNNAKHTPDEYDEEEISLPVEYYNDPEAYVQKEYEQYEKESALETAAASTVAEEGKM